MGGIINGVYGIYAFKGGIVENTHGNVEIISDVTLKLAPEECFEFDESTGTITKYDKENGACGIEIIIPETINGITVKKIGNYAFSQVRSVGYDENCTEIAQTKQLSKVVLPSGLEEIGVYAFVGERSKGYCTFRENNIISVDFSKATNLKSIGNYAFENNQLTSVTIKGKSSSADFTSYPSSTPFGWAEGYSDDNIIWNG